MNLDHAGIVGRNLDTMAAAFEAAGFTLTPLARHAGGRTGNRCAMFAEGGYLELMSTVDGGTSTTLDRFLARHEGAHLLAFGIDDDTAVRDRLALAWGALPDISHTDRAVDDADPDGPRARFSLIGPFDRPEGRIHLIRHETPDALWQPRFLTHANNALALHDVILIVPDPAVTAAWYSKLAGRSVVPDPSGGFALVLAHGRVRIMPPGLNHAPEPPCVAALGIRTGDGANAVRNLLNNRQIAHVTTHDCIQVKIAGVTISFR